MMTTALPPYSSSSGYIVTDRDTAYYPVIIERPYLPAAPGWVVYQVYGHHLAQPKSAIREALDRLNKVVSISPLRLYNLASLSHYVLSDPDAERIITRGYEDNRFFEAFILDDSGGLLPAAERLAALDVLSFTAPTVRGNRLLNIKLNPRGQAYGYLLAEIKKGGVYRAK